MRASLFLALTTAILLCSSQSLWPHAAPTSPIALETRSPQLESTQTQPQPFSGFEKTIEAALDSAIDLIHTLNNGIPLPESDQTDWSCIPSEQHPNPVILLHGLFAPAFESWITMAKRLKDAGYCVYQLKYGVLSNFATIGGISDIRDSAKELDTFISKVLSITSAQKVDLIGHSEGTVVARWYLKFLDRQSQNQESDQQQQQQQQQEQEEQREQRESRVRSLVSIAPVGKGTSLQGLLAMSKVLGVFDNLAGAVQQYCVACVQLLEGSDLLLELYGGDGAQGEVKGVRYLNIITSRDDMVTPFTNGVMTIPDAPKATVAAPGEEEDEEEGTSIPETVPSHSWQLQNLVIENHCAFNPDHSNHFGIFQSPFAFHATNAFLSSYSDSDSAPLLDSNAIPCTLDPESS